MRKADIRRGHKGNERISDMLEELHRTLFAEDDISWRGKRATRRFSLISSSREETELSEPGTETGWIEWEFTQDARRLIQASETYAVLNRTALLGFRSAYALKLYEIGALRIRRRQTVWKGDLVSFRSALGIPPEVYKDFAQLRRKVLAVCKDEIDDLAHFTVDWREIRRGRTIVALEIDFRLKEIDNSANASEVSAVITQELDLTSDIAAEKQRETSGRVKPSPIYRTPGAKAKKEASGFPSGSLRFGEEEAIFARVARSSGGGWDIDMIAEAFREHLGPRLIKLRGQKLLSAWKGFCESYYLRRGSP